jgi:hypothetical protein
MRQLYGIAQVLLTISLAVQYLTFNFVLVLIGESSRFLVETLLLL